MPSLEGADAWLDRAKEHLHNLKILIEPLIKAESQAIAATANFQNAGQSFGFNLPRTPAPNRVSVLAGESIQALRRALDYLVYELALLDSGKEQDGTQFPIDDAQDVFWSRLERKNRGRSAYLIGVKRVHAAAIERYQPYFGCDWTEDLRSISNPDKHRHLSFAHHDVRSQATRVDSVDDSTHQTVILTDDGFTVLWTVGDKVHMKLEQKVDIAFEDRLGVVETLDEIESKVTDVLNEFRPCFDGKCHH
jgi:hypothetical protein